MNRLKHLIIWNGVFFKRKLNCLMDNHAYNPAFVKLSFRRKNRHIFSRGPGAPIYDMIEYQRRHFNEHMESTHGEFLKAVARAEEAQPGQNWRGVRQDVPVFDG